MKDKPPNPIKTTPPPKKTVSEKSQYFQKGVPLLSETMQGVEFLDKEEGQCFLTTDNGLCTNRCYSSTTLWPHRIMLCVSKREPVH